MSLANCIYHIKTDVVGLGLFFLFARKKKGKEEKMSLWLKSMGGNDATLEATAHELSLLRAHAREKFGLGPGGLSSEHPLSELIEARRLHSQRRRRRG
jgi:hypothetical protein